MFIIKKSFDFHLVLFQSHKLVKTIRYLRTLNFVMLRSISRAGITTMYVYETIDCKLLFKGIFMIIILMAITKSPWPPFLFISDFFLWIISDQVKPSWIDVFLYTESDKTHLTVGKNASLANYRRRTVF